MSEEEKKAIERIKRQLDTTYEKNKNKLWYDIEISLNLIEKLLDLYNKEKEKNYILELEIDKLNQEKEQYKIVGQTNFVNAFKERNYISKDKIREKIKEYKAKKEGLDITYRKDDIADILRELLEE